MAASVIASLLSTLRFRREWAQLWLHARKIHSLGEVKTLSVFASTPLRNGVDRGEMKVRSLRR
jgi:hypothetical protein